MVTRDVAIGGTLILICIFFLWKDGQIRSGQDRSWLRNYHDSSLPWWVRNGFLVYRLIGVTSFCWGIGGIIASARLGPLGSLFGLVLLVAGLVAAAIAIVGAYRESDSLKPRWLRVEEQRSPFVREPAGLAARIGDVSAIAIPAALLLITLLAGIALFLRDVL